MAPRPALLLGLRSGGIGHVLCRRTASRLPHLAAQRERLQGGDFRILPAMIARFLHAGQRGVSRRCNLERAT